MKVDRLRCARLKKNWAGRVFYWEIRGEMENKKRDISNRGGGPIWNVRARHAHRHYSLLFIHYSFSQRQLLSHVSTLWISHRGYQRNVFTFSTVKMLKTRLKVWKTKRVFHTLHAKVVFSWGYMPARQQNIELLPWRCYNKHTVYRPDCPLWLWKTVPDGAENTEFSTNRRAYALDR